MRRCERPPLPRRFGLEPACVRMPADGEWNTVREFLVDRLAQHVTADRVDRMIDAGEIVDLAGPIPADASYAPMGRVWFHRDLPDEATVPFEIGILHRDDRLLVVDKPHFMATIPRGRHVLQTALVRLRHDLDLPDLVPAHRLDRATAGVLLFVVDPAYRGTYQRIFQDRKAIKTYEAIAPVRTDLEFPRIVRSRIRKDHGTVVAYEEPGEPNSESLIELLEERDGLGRYRLSPHTGKTHQLRVHMNTLGIPIIGDDFYPDVTNKPLDDFTNPLQLLAAQLQFPDPVTREPREFRSQRHLEAWPQQRAAAPRRC